ncbi:hypothetical protein J3B02_000099 [Coemansia erecta]|nr:hypothetical protein FB639_006578 [Coemansia asiatica]KAJ2858718.1 hypothetical protein J3B02_000099 [Coemansia erecta]
MLMMIIGVVFLVAMPGFSNGHNTFTRFKEPYQTMIFMLFWHPLMAVLVISDTTYIQALGRTEELSKGTVIMIYCAVGAAGVATLANIYGLFTGKKPGGAKKDDDKADVSN